MLGTSFDAPFSQSGPAYSPAFVVASWLAGTATGPCWVPAPLVVGSSVAPGVATDGAPDSG